MTNRTKKFLPVLLLSLAALCAAGMAGCGSKSAAGDENTLTMMTKSANAEPLYVQRIIDLYEEKTGKKIAVIPIKDTDFESEAANMFDKGNLPDLFVHYNDAGLARFNVAENFYYMNDQPWVEELTNGAKAYCLDKDGNILGLPFWENSISGCYYNKTMLDELGLKPAATQAEFNALCAALKSVGRTPLHWGASGCNWMFQFGLDPIFADNPDLLEKLNKNEITYADIPAVTDMVAWLENANQQGWFNADYEKAAWDDIAPAMGNGDVAMIFCWDTWFSMNLDGKSKYSAKDFALMPVFMGTTDKGTYEGGNLAMMMANKNSKNLDMALDFLAFCAKPENYNIAFDNIATVNCFKNQTTNIQSEMVTNAIVSVETYERVSTAWPKIIGYKQEDVGSAVLQLFQGKTDVAGCVALMDEYRIKAAREMGTEGF